MPPLLVALGPQSPPPQTLFGLHQLDAVAEGVVDIDPVIALKRLIGIDLVSGGRQVCHHCRKIIHNQTGMGFSHWPAILFDTDVNLHCVTLEPAPAAHRQMRRFGNFRNPKLIAIECTCLRFTAWRHTKLNMVDGFYSHASS